MKKNRKSSHKIKKDTIKLAIIGFVLLVSAAGNIVQIIIHNNLQGEAEDISWRLDNYRALQDKQINAVRQNCRRINETIVDPLGYYHSVLKIYSESLSNEYATNIKLRCTIPAFIVAGHMDFHNDTSEFNAAKDKMFSSPNSYILKESAFDEVKW